MIQTALIAATEYTRWTDLGVGPVAFRIGELFAIRWYSLAYIAGIMIGWWILTKMLAAPGAPMARRHADDFILHATLGVILGGRLGYCLMYNPEIFIHPRDIYKLWQGGMSFHGGVVGVVVAIFWLVRKNKLSWLRVHDYIACLVPPGMFLGRLANFVNGELWGRTTDVPWAIIFPEAKDDLPRHPSQLYEAGLEGLLLGLILWYLYKKTDARYYPGRLVGVFAALMGIFRFGLEYVREPDHGIEGFFGMTMGQSLSVPLILVGLYFVFTSGRRRERVEPFAGTSSIA